MKRDTAINVILVIAGIVLAIALFGAGVLWKSSATKGPRSLSYAPYVFRSENWIGHHGMNTRRDFAIDSTQPTILNRRQTLPYKIRRRVARQPPRYNTADQI